MGDVEGARALVTGAAGGIGLATARRLVAEGASVALLDRDGDRVRVAAADLGMPAFEVDVRDGDAVDAAVAAAADTLGGVTILVNNAGLGDLRPLHTVDERLWRRIVDVNLTGTFQAMRSVLPRLIEAGGGTIVNNASLSGLVPTRGEAAYSAAKAGVIALTAAAALEYGPAVRVNAVAPGFVRTPLTAVWDDDPDAFAPVREALPLRRMGEADEVADLIVYLASDRSSYVTGQTIVIDGGLSLAQAGTDAALARLLGEGRADRR